jgi:hypothetical protein
MVKFERLAEKIFGVLRSASDEVKIYTEDGDITVDPQLGTRFYIADPALLVTIDIENNKIELSINKTEEFSVTEKMQRRLKNLANEFLINYTVKNYEKSIIPRDFSQAAKINRMRQMPDQNVSESMSKMFGSKKTSYQQVESAKLLVRHRKEVDENVRGSRARNIKDIFIESGGERIRFPHNHLGGARAMARHMSFGGIMEDQVGNYITEHTGRLLKLKEFVRYAKNNKLINEGTEQILETINENLSTIKTDIARLSGVKSYHIIAERIKQTEPVELSEDQYGYNEAELRDMFTVKSFNEEFDSVLPTVNKMVAEKDHYLRKVEESALSQVWMKGSLDLTEEKMLSFESAEARMGYRLGAIASLISENEALASYVTGVSKRMQEGQEINAFEKSVISNVLENLTVKTEEIVAEDLKESIAYALSLEKYTRM